MFRAFNNTKQFSSIDQLTQEAHDTARKLASAFVVTPPTADDLRCIEERQLRHRAGDAVAVSPRCQHGFPQAFAFAPVGHKISSGLFRLSCPLLVQAIDKLEEDGGLEDMNEQLEIDHGLRQVCLVGAGAEKGGGRGKGSFNVLNLPLSMDSPNLNRPRLFFEHTSAYRVMTFLSWPRPPACRSFSTLARRRSRNSF